MRNLRGSRVLSAAVVLVLLGGLYALAGLRHPISLSAGAATRSPHAVPVTTAARACPAPGAAFSRGGGIAVMAAPGSAASAGHGGATVTRLAGLGSSTAGPAVLSITQPGTPRLAAVSPDRTARVQAAPKGKPSATTVVSTAARGGVVVQASGTLAQGLDVEQTNGASLPTAACTSPATNFWFVGPGQRTAGRILVYLMNPSGQAADADVNIFTDAGPLQQTTDNGIAVPPHGMIVQSLAPVLGNSRSLTLNVRTSVGQVAAAVEESTGTGEGAWLPAAQAPATRLVIPGLPASAGSRELYLGVPGVKDANVQVSAVTSRGTYEPTGAGGIDIPGGSAADISLPSLAGIPAAIKLTSSTPITASIMIPGGGNGSPGSFTAAQPALVEQGVVAERDRGLRATTLILSAPHATARVSVAQIASAGSARHTQAVEVSSGKSVAVALKAIPGAPRGTPFAVVITPLPSSGPVYAGRVITAGGTGGALRGNAPGGQCAHHGPAPPGPQRRHRRGALIRPALNPGALNPGAPGVLQGSAERGYSSSVKPGSTSSGSMPSSRANSSTTTSKTSSPSSSSLSARAASGRRYTTNLPGPPTSPSRSPPGPGPAAQRTVPGPDARRSAGGISSTASSTPESRAFRAGLQPGHRLEDQFIKNAGTGSGRAVLRAGPAPRAARARAGRAA